MDVRIEECRRISAAAVASLWTEQNCAKDTSRELCQTALKLNGNLGSKSVNLPNTSTVPINTEPANRCVTATKDAMFGYFVNVCPQAVEVKFFDPRSDKACSTGCATSVPAGGKTSINLYQGSLSYAACYSPANPVGYDSANSPFSCR